LRKLDQPGAWLIDRVLREGARLRWPALMTAVTGCWDLESGPFLDHTQVKARGTR
jgi:hypothetical protein